ncbi:hypothetical protein LguiA_031565 [Lonicera macranthoides]
MHPILTVTDGQSKTREVRPIVSPRWNPTREQIRALEDIYRSGTRTPNANQIQQITAMLVRFGRIEGKNVFYWFQNHKARERQKHRRQLESSLGDLKHIPKSEKKDSGLSRTGIAVGQKSKRGSPLTCSTLSEESVSLQRTVVAKREIDEQFQVDDIQLQQIKSSTNSKARVANHEDENRESKTLKLFHPGDNCGDARHNGGINVNATKNDAVGQGQVTNTNFVSTPVQFFEFLPLKR